MQKKLGKIFSITNNSTLKLINITFINGNSIFGGALQNNGGSVTITNCIFINNTAKDWGGAIYSHSTNITIENSVFINNTGNYGGALDIYFRSYFSKIVNCTFKDNIATREGGAIYTSSSNYFKVIDSKFINNIVTDSYGTGGAITNNGGENFTIINSDFINNTADYLGSVIYSDGKNFTILNSNLTNNKNSYVIFILGNTANITGCNIINNSHGIRISSSNNTSINYNRIFNNTNYNLNNGGTNTNADLNWWGNNTPTKITGIILNNYFVMNAINLTSLDSNGTVSFNYTFNLNDTEKSFDAGLLPYFITDVFTNNTVGVIETFDARFNNSFNVTVNSSGNILYPFVTDNEVQTLEGIATILDPIDPVDPVDPVDPIDPIDPRDPRDVVDPIAPIGPIDPIDPDIENTNKTTDNPTASATMKETGLPINLILLALLSVLSVLIGRKQN